MILLQSCITQIISYILNREDRLTTSAPIIRYCSVNREYMTQLQICLLTIQLLIIDDLSKAVRRIPLLVCQEVAHVKKLYLHIYTRPLRTRVPLMYNAWIIAQQVPCILCLLLEQVDINSCAVNIYYKCNEILSKPSFS